MHSPRPAPSCLPLLSASGRQKGRLNRFRNGLCDTRVCEGGKFGDQLVRHPSTVVAHGADNAVDVPVGTFDHVLDAFTRNAERAQVRRLLAHFLLSRDLHHLGEIFDVVGQVGRVVSMGRDVVDDLGEAIDLADEYRRAAQSDT